MAEIRDQIGRIGNFQDAAMEKLSSMLKSAVGKAVKYASEQTKSSDKDYENLSKALEELGDDLKENLKSTRKFVEEIKEVAKSFEKVKQARQSGGSTTKGSFESIQREQTKILGMILENQKKAQSAKIAKYTTGGSSIGSKSKLSLGDLGFKPKGTDKVPAMLSPGEFIVNRRGASRNSSLLDRINKGYSLGGLVKPRYLKDGDTAPGPSGAKPIGSLEAFRKFHATADVEVEKVTLDAAAAAEAEKIGEQLTKHISEGFKNSGNKELASWATGMSTALMGGGADFLQGLFAGSVTDATEFQREMRLIAFQTQGITGDFREMQSNFSDLGKVAAETGKSISVMQKVYMSNLKKGFKDNKEGMKVMKSGLFLSTMIGSEAQQTADLFGDWHRTLALTSSEMSELARGMRNVALSTGVTGDELLGAMKSSEGILKNLRNQGNLTADVSKTVIEMMAEAKKTGFDESTNRVLSALSSTGNILDADAATKGLIFTISNRMGGGATDSVLSGTFMKDRENLAGFSSELMSLVGNLSNGAIKSLEDFDKLSDAQKRELTLRLKGYGLTIAEAESLISTTKKASRGLAGNIEELDKIGSSQFATKAEKELASKQKSQAYLGASLDYLAAIGDEAKDKSLSDALKDSATSSDFKNKRQDFTAMAGALTAEMKSAYGIGGTNEQMAQQLANLDPAKAAELNALVLGDQLNKAAQEKGISLEKDYSSEIKNALARGDNAKFRELVDEAQKKAGEIAVDQQASTSPEEKLALEINKLNETIRAYTSSFVRGMVDYIGWMGLLLIQIGLLSTALYATFGKGFLEFSGIMRGLFPKGGLKGMFSKGGSLMPEGGMKGLLGRTSELGDLMKGSLIKGVEDFGRKGNIVFKRMGKRIDLFQKQTTDAFSGAMEAFKTSRKGFHPSKWQMQRGIPGRSGKGIFSSLVDAGDVFIQKMTGNAKKLSEAINYVKNSKIIKTAKVGFNSLFESIKQGGKRFKSMRAGGKNIFFSFATGFDQFSKKLTGGIKPFEKMSSMFSSLFQNIKNFKLSSIKSLPGLVLGGIKSLPGLVLGSLKSGIGGLIKGIRYVMTGGFARLIKGVGTGFRGGMRAVAGGLRAALVGGTLGTAQIIFSAIDMVFGAVSGFTNTGKNFEGVLKAMGKSTKDLTWGMYASSTIAGGLVGILDGLTFGLLSMTGATEWLNKALSMALYTVFSFVEGIVEGFMGVFTMVSSAFSYIGEQFSGIGKAFLSIFNSIAGIFGGKEAKSMSEAFAMMYPIIKGIGKAIGFIFGGPIAATIWVVVKAFSAVVAVVEILANVLAAVVDFISNFVKILYSIVTLDFKGAWKGVKGLGGAIFKGITGIFSPILKWLGSIGKDFMAPFKWLFENILGKGVMSGITSLFKSIPGGIYKILHSAASAVGLGWLVERIAGGKAKEDAAKEQATKAAAAKHAAGQSTTRQVVVQNPTDRNFEQRVAETYGSSTARRAVSSPGGGPVPAHAASSASYSMERASAAAATPVGHHAVPVARPNQGGEVGDVQPVHLRDISESILRDRAGTSGTGRVQSDELSRIEEASFRQVEELEQIKEGISEMVALLKPKGSGAVGGSGEMGPGRTKDPRRPLHAAQFGKMKYGKAGGNANRTLVNNGEV